MNRTILLDGDIVTYKIASTQENAVDWGDGVFTMYADAEEGKQRLDDEIESIRATLEANRVIVALSCPRSENWRRDVLPTYKANRDAKAPMILAALKQHLRDKMEVWERPTLEADDIIGIIATSPALHKGAEIVCVSSDKDFKTIPGKHAKLGEVSKGIVNVTEAEADYWHLFQALTGDPVDGYAGCPGTGKVGAKRILDKPMKLIENDQTRSDTRMPCSPWEAVVAAYEKAGLDESEALRMARVARICRNSDYDFKLKKVKLWQPPLHNNG